MAKRPTTLVRPRRGEVYLVNFDPTLGAKIQKTCPALIVQNDVANRHGAAKNSLGAFSLTLKIG